MPDLTNITRNTGRHPGVVREYVAMAMRAAYIERLGPAEDIRLGKLAVPEPGPTDVLVDVEASAVNPVDTFVRSGRWRTPIDFPFVIGRDLAGTVAAVGSAALGFRPGDRVWSNSLGHGGRQGSAAEQAVVPADRLYHLPDSVDFPEAAAVVHPAGTAYLALFTHGRLRTGEVALVIGAAGNVGSALVVLAREAGAHVIAVASGRDEEYCRSLGAADFVDRRDPDLVRRIRERSPDGVDVHLDAAGHNDFEQAVGLLAHRGRIVLLAGADSRPVLPAGELYMNDRSIVGFVISRATTAELAEASVTINRLLANGRLRPRALETAPLDAAAKAHIRMERGELSARRLVLVPNAAGTQGHLIS
ncbi:NADPH:quinone reductase [Kibdelosporangium aridum]|uniref:NADPH:quinone reductase n=1 Tax=Kibdelosporangium aridum TaxID=2030 RepID=UPI000A6B213D